MTTLLRLLGRYDRLAVLLAGACLTYAAIYSSWNKLVADVETTRIAVTVLNSHSEKATIFMEKQNLIDQRQNEILNDLKSQLRRTWRSGE